MDEFFDDDKHICLRCKSTIQGLDNYVLHRKSQCTSNNRNSSVPNVPRESLLEPFSFQSKQVETSEHNVPIESSDEHFSNDVIDLSTTAKRVSEEEHRDNILFTSVALNPETENKIQPKFSKTFQSNDTYLEPFHHESDAYSTFSTSRDQSLFFDYRLSMVDQTRKELFIAQNPLPSSADIFQPSHSDSNSITLFRSFDHTDIESNAYLSQSGSKYLPERGTFENKLSFAYPTILHNVESDNYLPSENNTTNQLKSAKDYDNVESQFSKSLSYDRINSVNQGDCVNLDSNAKDSSSIPVSTSEQNSHQNVFFSSLELKSNVARKIMKYDSDEDEDDYDETVPPSHYTGGKWPPGSHPNSLETGKWMAPPNTAEEESRDEFEGLNDIEQHSFQLPPPTYTKGKWLPGKRMTKVKYGTSVEYECKSCDRTLKGKAAFEKHLSSQLHFAKEGKQFDPIRSAVISRPPRATKQKAQEFIREKISLIRKSRFKVDKTELTDVQNKAETQKIPDKKCNIKLLSSYRNESDEEIDSRPSVKIMCPICRLSFSKNYCSQHFASLAHIHNELEFKLNPNSNVTLEYKTIIIKNIQSLVKSSNFVCKLCTFYTNSHCDFLYHIKTFHDKNEHDYSHMKVIYRCSACDEDNDLYTVSDVLRHLAIPYHKQNISYEILQGRQVTLSYTFEITCSLCQRSFRYNKAYRDHRRKFHKEEDFQLHNQRHTQCPECPYHGTNARHIRHHLREVHDINPSHLYFCFVCGEKFSDNAEASRHRHSIAHRTTLEKQSGKSSSRTCYICYDVVENLTVLRKHMIALHRKEITPCHHCGVIPPLKSDLTVHRKTCPRNLVENKGIYQCELCPFANDLLAHVLMHTVLAHVETIDNGRHYNCHICKLCIQTKSIKNHMLLHTNELQFSCNFCSRKFSQQMWLQKHLIAVHSTQGTFSQGQEIPPGISHLDSKIELIMKRQRKPRVKNKRELCEICGKSYTNRAHLRRHQLDLHSQYAELTKKAPSAAGMTKVSSNDVNDHSGKYICEVCGLYLRNASEFKKHRNSHRQSDSKGFSYPCPHCSYSTRRMFHLKRHLRLHTGAAPFKCHYCPYAANNQENLRKHMIKTQRHLGRLMYECQYCVSSFSGENSPSDKLDSRCAASTFEGRKSFGSNYAAEFKDHLLQKHVNQFRDKDEVIKHIRSYYHSDHDVIFTAHPKASKAGFRKRKIKTEEVFENDEKDGIMKHSPESSILSSVTRHITQAHDISSHCPELTTNSLAINNWKREESGISLQGYPVNVDLKSGERISLSKSDLEQIIEIEKKSCPRYRNNRNLVNVTTAEHSSNSTRQKLCPKEPPTKIKIYTNTDTRDTNITKTFDEQLYTSSQLHSIVDFPEDSKRVLTPNPYEIIVESSEMDNSTTDTIPRISLHSMGTPSEHLSNLNFLATNESDTNTNMSTQNIDSGNVILFIQNKNNS